MFPLNTPPKSSFSSDTCSLNDVPMRSPPAACPPARRLLHPRPQRHLRLIGPLLGEAVPRAPRWGRPLGFLWSPTTRLLIFWGAFGFPSGFLSSSFGFPLSFLRVSFSFLHLENGLVSFWLLRHKRWHPMLGQTHSATDRAGDSASTATVHGLGWTSGVSSTGGTLGDLNRPNLNQVKLINYTPGVWLPFENMKII